METLRLNEGFKRSEGANTTLGDFNESTGSSGRILKKQGNTDRTQTSVSSASIVTEILWVVCL